MKSTFSVLVKSNLGVWLWRFVYDLLAMWHLLVSIPSLARCKK